MKEKKVKTDETAAKEQQPKKEKKENKKPNFFKRMGRKIKEIFLELKKVTWPSFGKVVKQTGVVLAVCLVFLVVFSAIDLGLGQLMKMLTSI